VPELSLPTEHSSKIGANGGISLRWRVLAGNLITSLLAVAFAGAVAWGGWGDLRKREAAARALTYQVAQQIDDGHIADRARSDAPNMQPHVHRFAEMRGRAAPVRMMSST